MSTPHHHVGGGSTRGRGRGHGNRGGRGNAGVANAAAAHDAPAKPKSEKPKPPPRKNGGGSATRTGTTRAAPLSLRKVLIRNVPHDWSEDTIMEIVESHGGVGRSHVWRFVPGRVRSSNRAPRLGRLYLDFKKDTELAKTVIDKLHGFPLVDSKDGGASLDVAFAPYQKITREKQRKDPKVGTIERDPEYLAFVEALSKPKEKLPSADVVADSKESEAVDKPVAALVLYLNTRKRDKKGKFAAKTAEKTRGARTKGSKEKVSKEKGKGAKNKKTADAATKDAAKTRKVRGKSAVGAAKDTASSVTEAAEPGAVRIMSSRNREQPPADSSVGDARSEDAPPAKAKPSKSGNKPARRSGPPAPKDGDAEPAQAGDGGKDRKARRDNRPGRPSKGGGRGDQPKKIFAPKAPAAATT